MHCAPSQCDGPQHTNHALYKQPLLFHCIDIQANALQTTKLRTKLTVHTILLLLSHQLPWEGMCGRVIIEIKIPIKQITTYSANNIPSVAGRSVCVQVCDVTKRNGTRSLSNNVALFRVAHLHHSHPISAMADTISHINLQRPPQMGTIICQVDSQPHTKHACTHTNSLHTSGSKSHT